MSPTVVDGPTVPDTRARLIAVAVDLFTRHSFAGTSLQMIADHLGFTKAAIYHHFRTREQLLLAVLEPLLEELSAAVEAAEEQRSVHGRADRLLTGYATLAVRHRGLVGVLAADPSVASTLEQRAEWTQLIGRQLSLLADVDPRPAGKVKAVMVFAGMAAAAGPSSAELDDDELREYLVDAGRRTLGVRAPRRRERNDR